MLLYKPYFAIVFFENYSKKTIALYFYGRYNYAHAKSLQALVDCRINCLPVEPDYIAGLYGIKIHPYSQNKLEVLPKDGFIATIDSNKVVFIDDNIKTLDKRRFIVGHGLGHILLNHPLDKVNIRNHGNDSLHNFLDAQADAFSRDILAPACVLDALGVKTAEDIVKFCGMPYQSAKIHLARLKNLRRRNSLFKSPLERDVLDIFCKYIHENSL